MIGSSSAVCAVDGCERPRRGREWCTMHYDRWRHTGDVGPVGPKRPAKYAGATCVIDGCDRVAKSLNYCDPHYQRHLKHGDPIGGNPSPKVLKAVDHADGTRTCSECQVRQPLDHFGVDRNATLGRRSKCKTCRSELVKAWYHQNRERQVERQRKRASENAEQIREWDRKRYERDREKRLAVVEIAVHRRRARLASVAFDKTVTRANLRKQYGDDCYYCGVHMTYRATKRGEGLRPDNLATLEHIVPISKGGEHTWENVVLACWRCNIGKNKRDIEDWLAALEVKGVELA